MSEDLFGNVDKFRCHQAKAQNVNKMVIYLAVARVQSKNIITFCYRYLKPKGLSVYFKLDERIKIRKIT